MSHGVLIGPKSEDATVLDETEYESALQAVRLARSDEREESSMAYALRTGAERVPRMGPFAHFLSEFMNHHGDASEEIQGMFVSLYDEPRFLHDEPDGAEHAK